jgi:hypothetical protein
MALGRSIAPLLQQNNIEASNYIHDVSSIWNPDQEMEGVVPTTTNTCLFDVDEIIDREARDYTQTGQHPTNQNILSPYTPPNDDWARSPSTFSFFDTNTSLTTLFKHVNPSDVFQYLRRSVGVFGG